MKFIFIYVMFISSLGIATPTNEIFCTDSENSMSFSIDTALGKVMYNELYQVSGTVFSGVYSTENYVGEILGEVDINGASYYLTLIIRNVNAKAQLEAIWYPKNNQDKSKHYFLNNCNL